MLTLSRCPKHALTSRSAVKFACYSFRPAAGGACIALQSIVEMPVMIQDHKDPWLDMNPGAHCQCICAENFRHPFDKHASLAHLFQNSFVAVCIQWFNRLAAFQVVVQTELSNGQGLTAACANFVWIVAMEAAASAQVNSLLQRRPAWAIADAKGWLLPSVYPVNWDSTDGQNGTEPCTALLEDDSPVAEAAGSPWAFLQEAGWATDQGEEHTQCHQAL